MPTTQMGLDKGDGDNIRNDNGAMPLKNGPRRKRHGSDDGPAFIRPTG